MPVNRNALIRYKTIDKCLQNRYREWTLEDLIEACSEALYEYEGITKGISKRTIQLDIQMMRSDKLGYNAPIIVYDNKYYTYEDKGYSITNIPLTDQDLGKMSEAVEFMRQFKGFSHFRELEGMIQKLEDHVYSQKKKQKPVIDFEKNENLKGLEHLDILYQSIIQQRAVKLTYQSFRARQANSFHFHPYLLKEFRNRWFILGIKKKGEPILNLALDRIQDIHPSELQYIVDDTFNAADYFRNVIGVTVDQNQKPVRVILSVSHKHSNYVITKPLHSSQKVIAKDNYGVTIELMVQHNFELEKEILGLGEGVMVIAPESLKRSITSRLEEAIDLYNTSINEKGIETIRQKLENKGFAVISNLYTKKTLRHLESLIRQMGKSGEKIGSDLNIDPKTRNQLRSEVINKNIEKITTVAGQNIHVKEIAYHEYLPNDYTRWHQADDQIRLGLVFFLEHLRLSSFPVKVFPGSHKKKLTIKEIELITVSSDPSEILLAPGGALLIKPLLIRLFPEELKDKKMKFFELRFDYPDKGLAEK